MIFIFDIFCGIGAHLNYGIILIFILLESLKKDNACGAHAIFFSSLFRTHKCVLGFRRTYLSIFKSSYVTLFIHRKKHKRGIHSAWFFSVFPWCITLAAFSFYFYFLHFRSKNTFKKYVRLKSNYSFRKAKLTCSINVRVTKTMSNMFECEKHTNYENLYAHTQIIVIALPWDLHETT